MRTEVDLSDLTVAEIVVAIVDTRAQLKTCSLYSAKGIALRKQIDLLLSVNRARLRRSK
jgi:hypothetical protein